MKSLKKKVDLSKFAKLDDNQMKSVAGGAVLVTAPSPAPGVTNPRDVRSGMATG